MGSTATQGPIQNFDGISNRNFVAPPDPNIAVGENYVVQMVNISFAVYNKDDGSLAMQPINNNALWDSFGGLCETNNNGDPIVLYDEEAKRWVLSQFAFDRSRNEYRECVAVSQTSDPTGQYYRYAFEAPQFNDYPKLGVGQDSYLYTYTTPSDVVAGAFDRDAMLAGRSDAQQVLTDPMDVPLPSLLPADIDGPQPPSGTPGYFVRLQDHELIVYELAVNWSNPSSRDFREVATLSVEDFDPQFCSSRRGACISQPSSQKLETLSDRLMFRLQLRDMGDHLAMVTNHTVEVNESSDRAGIRWYELRKPDGSSWQIHQQGTYAPSDGENRWMGSIAMNANGKIGLSYSVSSNTTFPSFRYTGRFADDPLGEMTIEEQSVKAGEDSYSGQRWGGLQCSCD